MGNSIPLPVQKAFDQSSLYFPTQIQQLQFFDKYSRFDWGKMRRETWPETVDRATNYLIELSNSCLSGDIYREIRRSILNMEAMPSMRLMAMAGPAAHRNNLCIYNCAYLAIDCWDAFVETLTISMCGCGVGFSVESQYVDKLPPIAPQKDRHHHYHFTVPDSQEGWELALRLGLRHWTSGDDIEFDYSEIRPAGAPLMTKGGRASGPEPLRWMLGFIKYTILARQGKKLRPIDAHDIMCAIGQASISGGVRRTAMISLFDYDDMEMREAKNRDLEGMKYRYNANNSIVLRPNLPREEIEQVMLDMDRYGNGEPGLFSRYAALNTMPKRRSPNDFGSNPCGEAVPAFIPSTPYSDGWDTGEGGGGLCNLSMAIARPDDTFHSLKRKVEVATVIGTIQSMATYFPGLRKGWKKNCEDERLLGVDLAGQMDSPVSRDPIVQMELRKIVVKKNKELAKMLLINRSAATTVVKPSGNSGILLGCSNGIHPHHSKYYLRNILVNENTPMFKVLQDAGAPMTKHNGSDWWIHFPVKAPDGAILKEDMTALEQCEYWKQVKLNWTEHNPSVTITYESEELQGLIDWVYENQDIIGGMAFLPKFDAIYDVMPYEEITEGEYEKLSSKFPKIDFSRLYLYEESDYTSAAQTVACQGGSCRI